MHTSEDSRSNRRPSPPPWITTLIAPGTISTSSGLTSSATNPGILTTKEKESLDSRTSTRVSAWKGSSNTRSNRCGMRFSFLVKLRSIGEFFPVVAVTELVRRLRAAAAAKGTSTATLDAIVTYAAIAATTMLRIVDARMNSAKTKARIALYILDLVRAWLQRPNESPVLESRQTVFDTNDCSSSKKEKKERNRDPSHFLEEFSCQMTRSDDESEIMSKTETIVIFFSHNCKSARGKI
jgi:hypothetical protein